MEIMTSSVLSDKGYVCNRSVPVQDMFQHLLRAPKQVVTGAALEEQTLSTMRQAAQAGLAGAQA